MTEQQRLLLGNDVHFAVMPMNFEDSINSIKEDTHNAGVYQEIIFAQKNGIGAMGKFWKFVNDTKYFDIGDFEIIQAKGQQSACIVPLVNGIEKIVVFTNNDQKEYIVEKSVFKGIGVCAIDYDFNNPIERITLHFNYDLTEPLTIKVSQQLYKEPEIDYKALYLKNMSVSHACGQDLVNIKFQNCNNDVLLTKITLYSCIMDRFNSSVIDKQLMAEYKVEEGQFFKAIKDLAYGKYLYKVSQFDKDNNLIVETDLIEFTINAPNYGGKPTIVI